MRDARRLLGLLALGIAVLGSAGCRQIDGAGGRVSPLGFGGPLDSATPAQEADVQISLGRTAERRGDLDQAMAAYLEALTRDKSRGDAYQRLAVLHDRRGDFRRSAELYRQAIEADPGDAEIYCDMGYSLYLQRRWAEAERNLRQAIVLQPDLARAHNNLGLVLSHDHRPDEALAEYRKAGCDEAQARSNLALALTLDGDLDEARSQYRLAQAANPSAADPKDRLRELDTLASKAPVPALKPATVDTAHEAAGAIVARPPGLMDLSAPKSDSKLIPASGVVPWDRDASRARP